MSEARAATVGALAIGVCAVAAVACKTMDLYRWWESRHPLV